MNLRVSRIRDLVKKNGWRWTFWFGMRRLLLGITAFAEENLNHVELEQKILPLTPPVVRNSVAVNHHFWETYDWAAQGEEWTDSAEWKASLVDEWIRKYARADSVILEIGPGGGRWSEILQAMCGRLILVDLSETCIAQCRKRFQACSNVEYYVNDGCSLDFIADGEIDLIWSFDVFVHINAGEVEAYLRQFHRILQAGGVAIIDHPRSGGRNGARRSTMNEWLFGQLAKQSGLRVIEQFDSWGNGQFGVQTRHDMLSVLGRD